jgi:transcription elongation factor Elf1
LRNRRKWKETEFECPLCADLRVVLRHLLRRR